MPTLRDIPGLADWVTIDPLYRGWSGDEKFYIEDVAGSRFLLRVAGVEEYARKKLDYERLTSLSSLGIITPRPVDFGVCSAGSSVYTLLTWVDGQEAESILPRLTEQHQYELGVSAGSILHRMHSLPAPDGQEPWGSQYSRKIRSVIGKYLRCEVRVPHEESIMQLLLSNTSRLDGRPQTLQHGDYHLGNMLITPGMHLGIIDFNRSGVGDPWEEYDRFVFTWRCSVPFALGQIHGYFPDRVPDEFFRLMCLYNATNLLASIPGAIPLGAGELSTMLSNARAVAECYNGFRSWVPNWYREPGGRL